MSTAEQASVQKSYRTGGQQLHGVGAVNMYTRTAKNSIIQDNLHVSSQGDFLILGSKSNVPAQVGEPEVHRRLITSP